MKLYKTTIVIWTDFQPTGFELSDLAREAEQGDAYCSKREMEAIEEPQRDPDWDGTEFFNAMEVQP